MTSNGKPSEVFLLCLTEKLGGKTTIICAYSSSPSATKVMYELGREKMNNDTGYYVTSVELKQ
jgi:hypothetical protein|nr:MAG TPA: hypothetical protein [Caudoviricetes sp.]